MDQMGKDFQTLDNSRAGPAEVSRAIGRKNASCAGSRQVLYALKLRQNLSFALAATQVETAAGQDHDFRGELEHAGPLDPVRRLVEVREIVPAASNLDQFLHPVPATVGRMHPFHA